jgi:dynein heavy chain
MAMTVEDSITEALETDNLNLQNMSGQKYVQTNPMFLEAVAKWQKNLGTVDAVLNTWGDVQKKWQALESIFVGSADIRYGICTYLYLLLARHDIWHVKVCCQ